jgi:predicted GTPase
VVERQINYLEATGGCRVVGWSTRLADRAGLAEDLAGAQGFDVLLTELKAAAVDVGVELALARGAEVVFVDNRATVVDPDREEESGGDRDEDGHLSERPDPDQAIGEVIELALRRGGER